MTPVRPASILLASLLLGACASGPRQHDYDYSKEPDPRRSEYVIGVADQLSILVWKYPDISREVTVRPDGTITLPLIGDLTADGRTPSQLKGDIAKQLAKYIRDDNASVTVAVTAVNSYSFTVSGAVEKPGVFSSNKYVTVLDAMQLAGGPTRFGNPRDTQIMRRDKKGALRVIPIDYPAVLDGSRPAANVVLLAGDQVYVP
jgi:polysaccharide export outer membrane protein